MREIEKIFFFQKFIGFTIFHMLIIGVEMECAWLVRYNSQERTRGIMVNASRYIYAVQEDPGKDGLVVRTGTTISFRHLQ